MAVALLTVSRSWPPTRLARVGGGQVSGGSDRWVAAGREGDGAIFYLLFRFSSG